MKLKSTRYRPVFKASKGEKIMSALSPYRGVGMIGSWAGVGRIEQVNHLRNWSYVAIHCIARNLARHMPNVARVRYQKVKGVTTKYKDAPLGYFGGSTHTGLEGYGQGYQFVTSGSYYRKALSVIKPHEELEPLEQDHPLVKLLNNPNPVDTSFDLFYELSMFMDCCGVGYLWAVPNGFGKPCELWVIPSHWVWPRGGAGEGIYPDSEHANELIAYYEIRPWGGGRKLIFPPNEVIAFPWKNPLSKIDGYSTMSAIAQWIDTEESITKSQWAHFVNEPRPSLHVEMGPEFQDADDDRIARVEAKFMAKYQGEWNTGKPIITAPGTKVTPFGFNPTEMSYVQSEDQSRDKILSAFSVPGAAVGLVKDMTFGSILATLAALCGFCLNPRLVMMGQRFTKCLAPHFDYDDEEPTRIWWDDTTPPDPSQVNQDIAADQQCILPGQELQGQIIGGSKARYSGQAFKICTASGISLSVTRNHPVLTKEGFIPACQLKKGQNLLRYFGKNNTLLNPTLGTSPRFDSANLLIREPLLDNLSIVNSDYRNNAPTLVEDVFESLLSSGLPSFSKMSTVGVEFHGDAERFKGYVHIVGSYCKLLNRVIPKTAKDFRESRFIRLGVNEVSLPRRSSAHLMVKRQSSAFHRLTELFEITSSDFVGHFFPEFFTSSRQSSGNLWSVHGESSGFGSCSALNTQLLEFSPQPHTADLQVSSNLVDRFPRFITSDNQSHIGNRLAEKFLSFGPAANLDVSGKQPGLDDISRGTILAGELIDVFPGEIFLDEIINVESFHYDGPVYDFESPLGYIIVESLVVSNCLAITPNEVRAIRGRPAYKYGGDDPLISGPGGMVPLPLNTGEDLKPIADKIPIIPTVSEHGEEGENVLADEGELNDTDTSMPDMNPNIEEPNGKPHKELLKEVIKAALKKVSEPDNHHFDEQNKTINKLIDNLKEKKQDSDWVHVPDLPLIQKEKPPSEEVIKGWIKEHKPDNHLPPPPPVINVYATIQPAKVEVPPTVVNNEFSPTVSPTPIEVTNHIDVPAANPTPVEVINNLEIPASNPTPVTVENTVNVSPSDPTPILVKNENIVKVPPTPTREVKTATDENGKTITIVTERE